MKPVDQLILHDGDKSIGDCFRACVASILELPCEEVPHVVAMGKDSDDSRRLLNEWLKPLGFHFVELQWPEGEDASILAWVVPRGYYVFSGPSPRWPDCWHSCVGLGGKIVHDPHPERLGLAGKERSYGLFVADDPAREHAG